MVNAYNSAVIIEKYKTVVDSYAAKHPELEDNIAVRIETYVSHVFKNVQSQAEIGCKTWHGRLVFRAHSIPNDDELLEVVKTILKNEFDINLEKEKSTYFISGRDILRQACKIPRNYETEYEKPIVATVGDSSPIKVKPTIAEITVLRPVITYPVFENLIGELNKSSKDQRKKMFQFTKEDKFTDLDIIVQERTFHLHKAILASSCDYFDKLLSSGLRESSEDAITIFEITSSSFASVIEFIYLQECSFLEAERLSIEDKITFCFEMLGAADHFQLSDLFHITSAFICDKKMLNNNTVLQILELSSNSSRYLSIFEACLYHLSENVEDLAKCKIEKLTSILEFAKNSESKTLDLIVQHALARIIDDPNTTKEIFDKIHEIAVNKRGAILDLCLWHLRRGRFI